MLVAEPTGGVPHVAHKGVLWARASTEGVAAHGSAPHLGRNAIYPLAAAVAAIADVTFDVPPHPLLGEPTINVGTIAGGVSANVVPDRAEALIDVRTVPGLTGAAVLERLQAAAGPEVTLEPLIDLGPVATDPDDPWIRTVFEIAPAEPRGLAYFTDAAALTPAYGDPPTVIWGPGEAAQAHQTDEWAEAAKIDAAADAFTELARRWCHADRTRRGKAAATAAGLGLLKDHRRQPKMGDLSDAGEAGRVEGEHPRRRRAPCTTYVILAAAPGPPATIAGGVRSRPQRRAPDRRASTIGSGRCCATSPRG